MIVAVAVLVFLSIFGGTKLYERWLLEKYSVSADIQTEQTVPNEVFDIPSDNEPEPVSSENVSTEAAQEESADEEQPAAQPQTVAVKDDAAPREEQAPQTAADTDVGQPLPETQTEQTAAVSGVQYQFRKAQYLTEHFQKHRGDFTYATEGEYLQGANNVISNPNALHKLEAEDGDDVYYIESTREFVIVSTDGYIRTYFKADRDYYDRQ